MSSQIEGTQSSLSDLLLFEIAAAPGVPFDDVVEVSNYVAALEHGLARIKEGFPLSNRLIRDMHEILMRRGRGSEKQPGEFRRIQTGWVGRHQPMRSSFHHPRTACQIAWRRSSGSCTTSQTHISRHQSGARACAVRDDPPVSRRQRTRGPVARAAHWISMACSNGRCCISVCISSSDVRSIRQTRTRADRRRLGRMGDVLCGRCGRGRRECRGYGEAVGRPHSAGPRSRARFGRGAPTALQVHEALQREPVTTSLAGHADTTIGSGRYRRTRASHRARSRARSDRTSTQPGL